MIGVKINNTALALKPGSNLDLEINNPLFDTEIMLGEFALPFEAVNPDNNKTLGYFHEVLLKNRNKTFDGAQLQYKGVPLYRAIADILESDNDKIMLSLRLNFSGLACISKKLKEFDYGGLVDMGATQADVLSFMLDTCSQAYPAVGFNFPTLYNPEFYDGKNPDYENYLNFFDSDTGVYFNNTSANRQTVVPMVYLHNIIKCGFAYDGYTVLNTGFMTDTNAKKLIVYNNRALDQLGGSLITYTPNSCHVTCSSTDTITSNNTGTIQYDDETTSGNFDNGSNFSGNSFHIPAGGDYFIKTKTYFKIRNNPNPGAADNVEIRIKVGSTVVHTEYKTYYGVNSIISEVVTHNFTASGANIGQQISVDVYYLNSQYPTAYIELLSSCYISVNEFTTVNSAVNEFQKTFDPANHVPDITFMELLNSIRKTWNLTFKFDHVQKTVQLLYYSDIVVQTPVDLTEKELYGHKIRNTKDQVYKLFNYAFGSNDGRVEDNFIPYDDADYAGESTTPLALNTTFPAGAAFLKKKVYIKTLHQIWECQQTGPSTYEWKYFTDAYYDYISNPDGSIEIKPDWHPPMLAYITNYPNNSAVILPHVSNIGTSAEFQLGENPYDFQMFFYHGFTAHNSSQQMPTSSTVALALDGTTFVSDGLQWNDDNLISLWSEFLAVVQKGDFFIKKFRMNIYDFLRYGITDLFRWGQTTFLAKRTRFSIADEFAETETEFYKL